MTLETAPISPETTSEPVEQLGMSESEADHSQVAVVGDTTGRTECLTCGRDCRHGGGTAGSVGRYEETVRSRVRCPSCGGKLHRKESRGGMEVNCLWRQVARHNKLTEFPKPTAEIGNLVKIYLESGLYTPPPTEAEVSELVREQECREAGVPFVPKEKKVPVVKVVEPKAAGEVKAPSTRKRKTEVEGSTPVPITEGTTGPTQPFESETVDVNMLNAPSAPPASAVTAPVEAPAMTPKEEPEKPKAPRKPRAKKSDALVVETPAQPVMAAISGEPDPGTEPEFEDGYDPFAGVGEAWDETGLK